jgi:heme exporter protein CcmD
MNWDVLFAIGGHGAYVWSSFGMCFMLMAAEVISLRQLIRSAGRRE